MKICRFDANRLGVVQGEYVLDVSEALAAIPQSSYPYPAGDQLIAHLPQVTRLIESIRAAAPRLPLSAVRLLPPIANPGKLMAAPVNYARHLEEARGDEHIHHSNRVDEITRVGLFLKATSALSGMAEPVCIRHADRRNDHEIELVAIIGRKGTAIPRDRALEYVAGYCIGLDMTVRGPEERSLRKSVDGYAVLGPWMVTSDEIPDPSALDLELRVNGQVRQRANTRDLVLGVPDLIALASNFYTLQPGDVLFTGTPEGVGPVLPGDTMTCSIQGIGTMNVGVERAAE